MGLQDQVRGLANNLLAQLFYSSLGEVELSNHRASEAEKALKPALVIAEQNLASLRTDQERTSWTNEAAPAYLALVEAQLVQGRTQDALDTYEWYLSAPQRSFDSRTKSPRSNFAQPSSVLSIPEGRTELIYGVLPHGLAVWARDSRGLHNQWLPQSTEDLQALANAFYSLASQPHSEIAALQRDARNLYEKLIRPIEPWLVAQQTLVIETDGWLSRVPFEVLLDSNGQYLIEKAPIVHSLGQSATEHLHTDGSVTLDSPALVVGSSASSQTQELIPLPDVLEEADSVASHFRLPKVFKGGAATLANIQTELPSAFIFHFAGHTLTSNGQTGLFLKSTETSSPGLSLLDASTLRRTNLQNLHLAVLSACGTASTGSDASDFNNVATAFLRAGVPHVVASRWAVDSVETNTVIEDFYKAALSGQTVPQALRHAALRTLADSRTAHPYYWSAFSAYGRP